MPKKNSAIDSLFVPKSADAIYNAVVSAARTRLGRAAVSEDPKQTCVHLTAGPGGTAFAGLHPRKNALLLNVRLDKPLKATRIRKVEQLSKHRFNCETLLTSPNDVNAQLLDWLAAAHDLAKS